MSDRSFLPQTALSGTAHRDAAGLVRNRVSQRHPILSAAPSFDHLDPIGDEHVSQRLRDEIARLPNEVAVNRFVTTPGPAERVRQVADSKLTSGDRVFGAGLTIILVITPAAMLIASVLRLKGLC